MKKYLPTLLAAILVGMTVNSAYAADKGDVDDVTMDVINNSSPDTVTNNIQLPTEASQEADDAVGTADAKSESHDNATENASEDSQADAAEAAQEDSQDAEQEADQATQDAADAADASTSQGN